MKILDRFIIRSYIGPLTVTFFICVFVLLMQFLWMYIDDLVGKGLAISIIAELMLYASANLVPMALPLAVLLASIMVFGNLGENNELMAMKSSGIPLQRIMLPLIIFNLFIAINALLFTQFVLPYTNLRYGALLYDVRQQRPEINIKKGTFYEITSGLKLKIKDKDPETNMMYEVMIYDHRNIAGNMDVTVADSASMVMSDDKVFLVFTLFNGVKYEEVRDRNNYEYSRNNMPFKRQLFGEQKMVYELNGYEFSRTNTELFKHNYQMLNLKYSSSLIRLKIRCRKIF
ncbi:MAG: LptF/LptG family permease [Bacteroidales bacterium]|nr:LptF/LptG family permease [Bacteroidales bacterium]